MLKFFCSIALSNLLIMLEIPTYYFDGLTKLFLDLYLVKLLDILAFSCGCELNTRVN